MGLEALDKLDKALKATNVLSRDFAGTIMAYAHNACSEAWENGRKAERKQAESWRSSYATTLRERPDLGGASFYEYKTEDGWMLSVTLPGVVEAQDVPGLFKSRNAAREVRRAMQKALK
jgi:hypothetical protein